MLKIHVMRASDEETAQAHGSCGVCGTVFERGAVYCWVNLDGGPDELCERCLRGLCEWAHSEGLDVPWKDAHAVYEDARRRYTEPITTSEALMTMPSEEQDRIFGEAYLT